MHRFPISRFLPLLAIPIIIFIEPHIDLDYEKGIFYIHPLVRTIDFFIGIILYNQYRRFNYLLKNISFRQGSLLEISAFFVLIIFFSLHEFVPRMFRYGIYYWLPMSLIIVFFSVEKGILSRILQHRMLIYLGEISFSFYMLHMIIIKYGNLWFPELNDFVKIGLYLIVSLGLSILTFEYFEKPINRWIKNKYRNYSQQNQ